MMNQQTRRLSKIPAEVRAEISPWFIDKQAIIEDVPEKISKLDDTAKYVNSDLKVNKHQTKRLICLQLLCFSFIYLFEHLYLYCNVKATCIYNKKSTRTILDHNPNFNPHGGTFTSSKRSGGDV